MNVNFNVFVYYLFSNLHFSRGLRFFWYTLYIYIRNKMSFVYIRKILFLYTVYIAVMLLLDSWRLPSATKRTAHACILIANALALSPEAEDFLHSIFYIFFTGWGFWCKNQPHTLRKTFQNVLKTSKLPFIGKHWVSKLK
jgi:hypothetical protein